uniref:Mirror-image polydactyly 1 n=1 Tax=Mola mola TaxID=94237 RepID=A0A3Q3XE37_MOLML
MVPVTVSSPVQSFDRDRNIPFLLKELDALRDVHKKVQVHSGVQYSHCTHTVFLHICVNVLRSMKPDCVSAARSAAVLEELLAAQKDRDQALMSRLRLANEERDEAITFVFLFRLENVHLEDSDMDVDELLRCVCDANSIHEVEQFGSVLVHRLQLARQRRHDITAQEMKAVIEERDGSVSKCKRLEQDLVWEREQRASEVNTLSCMFTALCGLFYFEGAGCRPPSVRPVPAALTVSLPLVLRLERLVDVLRKKVGTGSLRAVI